MESYNFKGYINNKVSWDDNLPVLLIISSTFYNAIDLWNALNGIKSLRLDNYSSRKKALDLLERAAKTLKGIGVSATKRFPEGVKSKYVNENSKDWHDCFHELRMNLNKDQIEIDKNSTLYNKNVQISINAIMDKIMNGSDLIGRKEFEEAYKLRWS